MSVDFENNNLVWNDKKITNVYSDKKIIRLNTLFPPENSIVNSLEKKNNLKVLDLGVGAGRTTKFLMDLADEYVGIDYSQGMINACKKRYDNYPKLKFFVADAQNLNFLDSNYFDFILFSYNGIDYVDHSSRTKIFKEIYRLSKDDGIFCFSTHNINYLENYSFTQNGIGIKKILKILLRKIKYRWHNKNFIQKIKNNYAYIIDPAMNWKVLTYYTDIKFQTIELEKLGFSIKCIFNTKSGKAYKKDKDISKITDKWIYFMTTKVEKN